MKYNNMKLIVGLFVIILFVTVFTFLFLLFKEKGFFEKRYSYHFKTKTADYFSVGMPLKLSGFKIGALDNISLENDGSVEMTFSVTESKRKWMSEGSVLMIVKPLIGSPHIELYTSIDTPLLKDGASLTIISSDSINDLIMKVEPIVKKSLIVLDNVEKITSYLASEDSELTLILQNMEKLTTKLANDDSLLTSLTGDKSSAKNITKSLDETTKILKNIKQITKDMNTITASLNKTIVKPASSSISEINLIMKDIKQKLDALDGTVKTIGTYDEDLGELKEQITVGIQKSNQIIDKVDAIMSDEKASEVTLP